MLIVPRCHPLAFVGQVPRDGLYSLTFVSLFAGSSQETTLRKHGILWRRLKVDMVRCPATACAASEQRVSQRCSQGVHDVPLAWSGCRALSQKGLLVMQRHHDCVIAMDAKPI